MAQHRTDSGRDDFGKRRVLFEGRGVGRRPEGWYD